MRDFLHGAVLSYKALFTWLNPLGYLSSRIVRPIGLTIAFAATSSHYGVPVGPTLVGTSLLAGAHAVIYGMALSVGNEHNFGTMPTWLASPQNILGAICQRAVPHVFDGFVSAMLTYLVCALLFGDLFLPVPAFTLLLLLALLSSFGVGLVVGGVNLRVRDQFVWPNIAVLAMMLFAGVLITAERLPSLLRPLADAFPLSHLMAAVRTGSLTDHLATALLGELAVAAAWAAAGTATVLLSLRHRTPD
ncbi:ABC transporter permease [Catellatospora sp. NPDC049111]|uniref:ABC transporter permease n=1 Tax=Catellatospora sp. NPDC049111 TaxID=3155271 RepID=UPI0033E6FB40